MSGGAGGDKVGWRPLALGTMAVAAAVASALALLPAPRRDSPGPAASGADVAPAAASRSGLVVHARPRPLPAGLRFVRGDGRAVTLGDLRGRAVLLNVWATWCAPCREEMPALDRLQAALGGAEFEVVALSIDRQGHPAVASFYQGLGLRALGVYVDPTGAAGRELGAVGIPTTLLVDRGGMEVARKVGPAEWDGPGLVSAIRKILDLRSRTGEAAAEARPE